MISLCMFVDYKPSDSLIVLKLIISESQLNIAHLRNSVMLSMAIFFETPSVATLDTIR